MKRDSEYKQHNSGLSFMRRGFKDTLRSLHYWIISVHLQTPRGSCELIWNSHPQKKNKYVALLATIVAKTINILLVFRLFVKYTCMFFCFESTEGRLLQTTEAINEIIKQPSAAH